MNSLSVIPHAWKDVGGVVRESDIKDGTDVLGAAVDAGEISGVSN